MGGTQISIRDSIVVAQAKTVGPREAAEEISRQLASLDLAMIIVFVSPFYDPAIFIEELTCRIPDAPIFGCTTAGELAPSGWEEDSVVAMGFSAEDFIVAARPFLDLSAFRVDHGRAVCGELHQDFTGRAEERDCGEEAFGFLSSTACASAKKRSCPRSTPRWKTSRSWAGRPATVCGLTSHGSSTADERIPMQPS